MDIYNYSHNMAKTIKDPIYPVNTLVDQMVEKGYILIWYGPSWGLVGIPDTLPVEVYDTPDGYLIFAQVDTATAMNLYLEIYRDIGTYDSHRYLVCKLYPESMAKDIEYYYPVKYTIRGDFTIFSSDILTDKQLKHAVEFQRCVYTVQYLDTIIATYAAYLTMENTGFLHDIQVLGNDIYIDNAGYSYGNDLYLYFMNAYGQIVTDGILFTPVTLVQANNASGRRKSFPLNGQVYLAYLPGDNVKELIESPRDTDTGKSILEQFGYRISPIDLPKIPDLVSGKFFNSSGQEMDIPIGYGSDMLYKQGKYFSKKFKAFLISYPERIPSFDTLVL